MSDTEVSIEFVSCTCYQTDQRYWFRYGDAVEPGSQLEPNPDCQCHFPREARDA